MSQKSTDYKRQFNAEKYGRIEVHLPKDLVDNFKATCKRRKTSQAAVIKKAVEDFINE